ncbi:hypothetical protein [Methanoregula formicica]|uniref:Uncharacterized protein n=1 Tax=Methanoregula formicica (strain DSM 22288 / NBRC 105244 / SMSP) TaxID=593750 RepID=L0HEV1_METFS|nr:hypothetical protein [Methanoregula formicica]AGB02306.1 hypothetical protein Metfor_1264 [Methanoregula formicica SMSP]
MGADAPIPLIAMPAAADSKNLMALLDFVTRYDAKQHRKLMKIPGIFMPAE